MANTKRRKLDIDALAPLFLGGAIALAPTGFGINQWLELQGLRREWTVKGPPCAQVAQLGRWVGDGRPPRTIRYGPYAFTRWSGAILCGDIPEPDPFTRATYRVCQFNNPGAVAVDTGSEKVTFQPPVGERATVTVRRGHASCVVGGWFDY
jgi:hypothetical protein